MADSIAFTTFVLYMLGMAALAIRGFFVHNALAAHAIAAGFKPLHRVDASRNAVWWRMNRQIHQIGDK